MNAQEEKIELKLVSTNVITRWPCDVCGGCTEKVDILCESENIPDVGVLRVCETCLREGNIDQELRDHARHLEEHAKYLLEERVKYIRGLIGRLVVPTYEQWCKAMEAFEAGNWADPPELLSEDIEDTEDLSF